jgi:hypothetical protein
MKRKLKECFSEPPFETWEANAIYPEFVLGKALPNSCIKWTKDVQLLYGKKKVDKGKNRRIAKNDVDV